MPDQGARQAYDASRYTTAFHDGTGKHEKRNREKGKRVCTCNHPLGDHGQGHAPGGDQAGQGGNPQGKTDRHVDKETGDEADDERGEQG
jgi:hypothetical protein